MLNSWSFRTVCLILQQQRPLGGGVDPSATRWRNDRSLRIPAEDRNRRAPAAPDYSVSANVAICAPCWSTALALRLGGFETSRIQEACGLGKCGSGDTPTLSPSGSPTRMRGSSGACLLATASMTSGFRFAQP